MAKSSFFSGTGTTPTNVESVSSSKAAAEASENAAAASAAAAAQSATQAGTSLASANTAQASALLKAGEAADSATAAAASAASVASSETNSAASATAAAASETAAAASATAAGNSQVSATQSSNLASTKATEASTSATNAATSATNASASETAAAASETAAAASETAAAASETAASASETAAAASETAAATSETNAASSATSASTSATTATTQATNSATSATQAASSATNAATSETNASASETAAAASETAAATSETNAANSATASATSATNSANSATASANSATAAAGSASAASTSATDAATSETNAATSETNAASSATSANSSQVSANQSASVATTQATNASTSATAASNSATAAAASETAAASSESAAATSETNAATSASNASSSASAASGSATTASTQATNASNSATAAATSATNSANSATASANSASAASTSATAAASSASSAQASKDAALAALDNFDDRYLGQKANDPSTDNDGDALVAGALYFNTTSDIMKVYDGSAWVAAYASLSGTLTAANNLSDLDNASDARSNLGLAIGTDVQAYSATLAGTTASYTTAEETKLAGIESGATGDQSASEILTAIKTVDGSGSGLDADTLDGSHASAFLTGNQTITLSGDASGSGTTSINVTVANDSHTHDGRYYTETEADSRFVNATGDTITSGTSTGLTINHDTFANGLVIHRNHGTNAPAIKFKNNAGDAGILFTNVSNPQPMWRKGTNTTEYTIFNDSYHPNADKWTTARTLSLTGAVTGSVSWDGSGNASLATTATSDPTLTLSGDASGSATFTNLGNATLSVTVANDSHTHDGRYYTETEADGRFLGISAKAADSNLLDGIDSASFVRSDASDTLTGATYTFSTLTDQKIILAGSSNPYIRWREGTTDRAYIQWKADQDALLFRNQQADNFDFMSHDAGGAVNLRLRGSDNDTWGSVYADDNSNTGRIGFLDDDQNWAYRITSDSVQEWFINNTEYMQLSNTGLSLHHDANDVLNFSASSTNDARGISFNGRTALSADYNDGWLRLNQLSEFSNGIYTPNNLRVDGQLEVGVSIVHQGDPDTYMSFGTNVVTIAAGGHSEITVNSTGVRLGDTGNGYFQPVSGNYGSIQIDGGAHGGWEGYSIGGRVVFMHDNSSSTGLYNDVNNEWLFYGVHNSYTRLYYNGAHKLETTNTGVTIVGDLNSTSDIRYKKNIETIDNALEKVQSLRGVTYNWDNDAFKEDDSTKKPNFTERATGVIAQDVEKVLPEAVRENEDGFKNVAYGNMVGLLIEAIKEQQEQIDALKKQLNG